MSKKDRQLPLGHPSLWPMRLAVVLFKQLSRLPWGVQVWLGRWIGRFVYYFVRLRRRVVDVNLEICFPECSKAERCSLARSHYEAMGIGFFETAFAWWGAKDRLPPYELNGAEHLDAVIAEGKGVLLLTAHFTTLEICGRFLSDLYPLGGLYREPDNRVIAREMRVGRVEKLKPAVKMDDVRGLVRALKKGSIVWYAPDQGRKGKFSEVLPFFGVPALTNTATGRIAAMSGARVVPYFGYRKADGGYLLRILPPLEDFPTDDIERDALRVTALIEGTIREAPEQYFWMHRRFKRRGGGFEDPYQGR